MRSPVTSTYRFQLHSDFTFADAEKALPYLADLGISHVYCSPILTAVPGSRHGYDVIDHTRINPELGGRDGFISLASAAKERGMGVIVDVVPNHMAFVAPENTNAPVWSLLTHGQNGPMAHWFDVDWGQNGGRVGIPILGNPLVDEVALANVRIDAGGDEPVVRYYEHIFPLAPGTYTGGNPVGAELLDLLDKQHYLLAFWRDRDAVLNYRRFFDVNELIAIRVEDEDVFDASHALLLDLHDDGHITGFRIDHPDGLADPEGYLARLAKRCGSNTPIWVEKILEPGEDLPESWKCAGTTGYDAMTALTAALADPAARTHLEAAWNQARDPHAPATAEAAAQEAKRYVVSHTLKPEIDRLTRIAARIRPELDAEKLRDAISELVVAAPVYRAYMREGERMSTASRAYLAEAVDKAKAAKPEVADEIDAIAAMAVMHPLSGTDEFADLHADVLDFATRLQQTWGPAMAKSIEDTLFYRWHLLTAVNEVGSEVTLLDHAGPQRLHEWAQHTAQHWPMTMTGLSTHDTKRSEDVRAALLVLASDEAAWRECSEAAFALADVSGVDRASAHLVWQTIAAMGLDMDPERLEAYLTKALREAKVHTAWIDGDEAYERQVLGLAAAILKADEPLNLTGEAAASAASSSTLAWQLRQAIAAARKRHSADIALAGHTQKALQMLLPGVPDTYQGSEAPTLSLVDPDNRRPVDYRSLATALHRSGSRGRLVHRLLADDVRAACRPGASYTPLETSDTAVFGFTRSAGIGKSVREIGLAALRQVEHLLTDKNQPSPTVAIVAVRAGAAAARNLDDVTVDLPHGRWRHAFSGERLRIEGPTPLSQLGEHEFGQLHVLIKEQR